MAGTRRSGGANVSLATQRKRRSGGAWTVLTVAKRRIAGAWVDLFTFFQGVSNQTIGATQFSPADASITYTINAGASPCLVTQSINAGAPITLETWLLAGGTASDYAVRATLVSGTLTSGTTGTWLQMTGGRSWNVTRTSNLAGVNSAVITIEMALWNGGAIGPVLDSATINMSATVEV